MSPRLHFSERAAFLYLIDSLSQWSPYCTDVDHGFLGVPDVGESDRVWLQRYASAREPMGYDAETDLFLWAESGYPPEGRSSGHLELKNAVDHFWANPRFREPLSRRMKELERLQPSIEEQVGQLQTWMVSVRGVVDVFRTENVTCKREVPLFVVYTLHPHSSQGGANGGGLYTSVDPFDHSEDLLRGNQILHEYLHLALQPREHFRNFTQSRPDLKVWHEALSGRAPDERGDDEASMLDEILVYALADVVVGGRNPEREMRNYAALGNKQMVRTWDGVRTLLPIIRRQIEKPRLSRVFLFELIDVFMGEVHHDAWSCPDGITVVQTPG